MAGQLRGELSARFSQEKCVFWHLFALVLLGTGEWYVLLPGLYLYVSL